jgi:hypothetical protein
VRMGARPMAGGGGGCGGASARAKREEHPVQRQASRFRRPGSGGPAPGSGLLCQAAGEASDNFYLQRWAFDELPVNVDPCRFRTHKRPRHSRCRGAVRSHSEPDARLLGLLRAKDTAH